MVISKRVRGTGLISKYLRYVEQHEAPQSMHLVSLMSLFAGVIGQQLAVNRGYMLRLNVYSLLVGPPATRKNVAMRLAKMLMQEAGFRGHIFGKNVTDEGVLTKLQKLHNVRGAAEGMFFAEELGVLLGGKKYQEGMLRFLIDAFDGGAIYYDRRGEDGSGVSYGVPDLCVNLLTATTPEDLRQLPEASLRTGLTSRVWIVNEPGQERMVWRPRFDPELRKEIVAELAERVALIETIRGRGARYEPGPVADKVFEDWYLGPHARFRSESDPLMSSWVGRRHDHAMKAAVLMHVLDSGGLEPMDEAAAQRGIAFVQAMEPGMFLAYGALAETTWAAKRRYAMDLLRKKGDMGVRQFKAAIGHRMAGPGESGKLMRELEADEMVEFYRAEEGSPVRVRVAIEESESTDPGPRLVEEPEPTGSAL